MAAPHPGKWERVLNQTQCLLSTVETAVHACLLGNLHNQKWKVLLFFAGQGQLQDLKSAVWDPGPEADNPISFQNIPAWPIQPNPLPRLFCSGHAMMPDGRLLVAGGEIPNPAPPPTSPLGLPYTYIFNEATYEWEIPGPQQNPHAMDKGRYYPTITTLGAGQGFGKILAMSGLDEDGNYNKVPEIYNPIPGPDFGWNQITDDAALQPFEEAYPGSHVIPFGPRKGKIFYSIPMLQAYTFNPYASIQEAPFWVPTGPQRSTDRHDGNSILLPLLPGAASAKVLITCGGFTANNSAEIIELADTTPVWNSVQNMFIARRNAKAVILPDDRILIIGGNKEDRHIDPRFTPEAFDPTTGEWTLLPAMNIERSYHSVAILLPDGRVWLSGTTHLGGITTWQHNIELYSPGYLFEGDRPEITDCPENIIYGTQFTIKTDTQIANIRLIRFGSMTHSLDTDQRSVGLVFTEAPSQPNGDKTWLVTAPTDADIAPPGLYMLFVLRAKNQSLSGETAIPSIAKIVRLTSAG
jgi:galactose oxidase